ncbi:unnamed protein product [Allacma fusca]|uniref:Uncharacterized protein n=1 Tax=Allacma fusca TaxID=39272 RepID=A0A8J2LER4_9HEXA|nr:unnamed protein product [Allacma fusca]
MKLILLTLATAIVLLSLSVEQSEGQIWKHLITGGRKIGGSGKPHLHFILLPSRKAAENAARNAGKGNTPVHHTAHKPGQHPHFHPADRSGNIIKDGSHYGYTG